MSLPRFLDRVVDATVPALGGLDRAAVADKLAGVSVNLVAGERAAEDHSEAGYLLAANLAARLYPRIAFVGPAELVQKAMAEVMLINPSAELETSIDEAAPTLGYETVVDQAAAVSVGAREWNVFVDPAVGELSDDRRTAVPAALLAAVLGVGELFRTVFARELQTRARSAPAPAAFNLVTLGEPRADLPVPAEFAVGEFRLAGAGAVGQAAVHTLACSGAHGKVTAVDPETIALSNLQRYVLTRHADIGAVKVELLRDRLAGSALDVVPVRREWNADLARDPKPTLVALDSVDGRIGVQASLPGPIYNAWTQPADVGWSRHEEFGTEPCLACLYWPQQAGPSRHEQIAAAFRQHPLRILAYLVHRQIPIGLPLPAGGIPTIPGLEIPSDLGARWLATALIDDIAAEAGVSVDVLESWRHRPLADVYQDGICGGGLLHLDIGEAPREVVVPLAQQSAFAGVMLATEFLVSRSPELRALRRASSEGRFDVLAAPFQVMARPRARTNGCLCSDSVFWDVYRGKVRDHDRGPA